MPKVYVVQEKPDVSVVIAGRFGDLIYMLRPGGNIQHHCQPTIRCLKEHLRGFLPEDYILPIGDPVAIGMACAIAAERTGGFFNMLKWDKGAKAYYPISVDLEFFPDLPKAN